MSTEKPVKSDKVKRPMTPAGFVLPLLVALGHAAFLGLNYQPVQDEFYATQTITVEWWKPVVMSLMYVIFVYVGKQVMQKRDAVEPLEAMLVHNFYQTLLSVAMFVGLAYESFGKGKAGWHEPIDAKNGGNLAFWLWVNYQSKFIEYFDTMFMLLRKSFGQVSVLHVSHHAEMGFIMWLVVEFVPGGVSYFPPMLNSLVHTVMYAYYALAVHAAIGIRPSWKQAITAGQLVQFVLVMAHAVYAIFGANSQCWPLTLSVVSITLMIQMLYMFGDFFKSTYMKPKSNKKDDSVVNNSDANIQEPVSQEPARKPTSELQMVAEAFNSTEPPSSRTRRRQVAQA